MTPVPHTHTHLGIRACRCRSERCRRRAFRAGPALATPGTDAAAAPALAEAAPAPSAAPSVPDAPARPAALPALADAFARCSPPKRARVAADARRGLRRRLALDTDALVEESRAASSIASPIRSSRHGRGIVSKVARTTRARRDRQDQSFAEIVGAYVSVVDAADELDPARLRLPEKPALEGLEAKGCRAGRIRRLPFRPHAAARRGVLDRHAAADRQRIAPRRPRLSSPYDLIARSSGWAEGGVLPDGWDDNGLPTERRVQNYYASAAIRRCRTWRRHAPPQPPKPPLSVSRPNFIELCAG